MSHADVVAFDEAVADVANLKYDQAGKKFASLLQVFENAGDKQRASETMFWMGYCYEKTSRKEQAVVFYEQLIRKYPKNPASLQAQDRLAVLQAKTGNQ